MAEAAIVTRHSGVIGSTSTHRDLSWKKLTNPDADLSLLPQIGLRRNSVLAKIKEMILAKTSECAGSLKKLPPRGRLAFLNLVYEHELSTPAQENLPQGSMHLFHHDKGALEMLRLLTRLESEAFTAPQHALEALVASAVVQRETLHVYLPAAWETIARIEEYAATLRKTLLSDPRMQTYLQRRPLGRTRAAAHASPPPSQQSSSTKPRRPLSHTGPINFLFLLHFLQKYSLFTLVALHEHIPSSPLPQATRDVLLAASRKVLLDHVKALCEIAEGMMALRLPEKLTLSVLLSVTILVGGLISELGSSRFKCAYDQLPDQRRHS
ncbi:hypothetical protein MNV49_007429 [Pseudohyphozyma bogoriensis]|nr:hypothetical protein MNV49_007429 [Pseudohyphozyma bogoriensis]